MFRIVHPLLHYYSNKEDGALPIGFPNIQKGENNGKHSEDRFVLRMFALVPYIEKCEL